MIPTRPSNMPAVATSNVSAPDLSDLQIDMLPTYQVSWLSQFLQQYGRPYQDARVTGVVNSGGNGSIR